MRLGIHLVCKSGKVRENNEDIVFAAETFFRDGEGHFIIDTDDLDWCPVVVADGMGGHERGEYASEFVVRTLKNSPPNEAPFEEYFNLIIKTISDDLNALSREEHQQRPMGSTLTGVIWYKNNAYLINAGDSRVYRYRDGIIRQLTTDQENEKGQLTNCLGAGISGSVAIELITDRIYPGDILLICSDGLSEMISDKEIESIISEKGDMTGTLYAAACKNGAKDNISIILVEILP